MTLDDILVLTRAGFTKDDIFKLTGTTAPAPEPIPAPTPEPAPAPAPAPVDMAAEFAALRDSIIEGIRGANLANTQQPAQMTADDVLASIINPPTR